MQETLYNRLQDGSATLVSQVSHIAALDPDRIFVRFMTEDTCEELTYGELARKALATAEDFHRLGIAGGDTALVAMECSTDLICTWYGLMLAGAIPAIVPFLTDRVSPEKYNVRLINLVRTSRAKAIVTFPELANHLNNIGDQATKSARIICCPHAVPSPCAPSSLTTPAAGDIALLQYSSGTTGAQKGVALSHRSIINQILSYSSAIRLNCDDAIVSWLPLYHDMGLIAGFVLPLLTGVPLVLMSPFEWVTDPKLLFIAISRYRGTLCWMPNFAFNFCADRIGDKDIAGLDISSIRAIVNCSEPMSIRSHEKFYDRFRACGLRADALAVCYAMAENTFAVTQGGIDKPAQIDEVDAQLLASLHVAHPSLQGKNSRRLLSVGTPISKCKVRVIDDRGESLPDRTVGEIAVSSNSMLTGYFCRPDLTDEALFDGWYRTGDLGYLVGDDLYVTGRKKDLIIIGGKNIYPQDVEEIVSDIPGVHSGRVVACGLYNEDSGTEDLAVIAELDTEDPAREGDIRREIRRRVAQESECIAKYILLVPLKALIKTSSGKVARSDNRERFRSELLAAKAPRGE